MKLTLLFIFTLMTMSLFGQIQGEGAIEFQREITAILKEQSTRPFEVVEIMTDWKRKIFGSREKEKFTYTFLNDSILKLNMKNAVEYYSLTNNEFYPIDSTLKYYLYGN